MNTQRLTRFAAPLAAIAFATGLSADEPIDFSACSMDDLVQLSSQVQNMNEEDHLRFLTELQLRAGGMAPEQRVEAGVRPEPGRGQKQDPDLILDDQLRDGTGEHARGRAGDPASDRQRAGTGSDTREGSNGRAADFQSYGSGYQSRRGQGGRKG